MLVKFVLVKIVKVVALVYIVVRHNLIFRYCELSIAVRVNVMYRQAAAGLLVDAITLLFNSFI